MAIDRQHGGGLRGHERRAVRRGEGFHAVLRQFADGADVAGDVQQTLLFFDRECRAAHDDRPDNRLPGLIAPRHPLVVFAFEQFLVVDLLEHEGILLFGLPDGGGAAALPPGGAVEREHAQQGPHHRLRWRQHHRNLEDVALVQQCGTVRDAEILGLQRDAVHQQLARCHRQLHHAAHARFGRGDDQAFDGQCDGRMVGRVEAPRALRERNRARQVDGAAGDVGG